MKYFITIICLFVWSFAKSQKNDFNQLKGEWISTNKQDSVVFTFKDSSKCNLKSSSAIGMLLSQGKYKLDTTKHPPILTIIATDEAGVSTINKWVIESINDSVLNLQSAMDHPFKLKLQKVQTAFQSK